MLLKLVELRSSDWGRVRDAAAASNATPDNDPNYFMVSIFILSAAPRVVLFKEFLYFDDLFPFWSSEWAHILHRRWNSVHGGRSRWGLMVECRRWHWKREWKCSSHYKKCCSKQRFSWIYLCFSLSYQPPDVTEGLEAVCSSSSWLSPQKKPSGPNVYSTCRVFEHLSLLFDRICWEIPRASGQTGLFRRYLWREWKRSVSAAVNLAVTPNSVLITFF